jgi:hypothetical protein
MVTPLLGDSRFFGEHHGNLVPDRVHASAGNALKSGLICKQLDLRLAHGTYQDVQSVFRNFQRLPSGIRPPSVLQTGTLPKARDFR